MKSAYEIVMAGFAGCCGAGLIAERKASELRSRYPVFIIRNAVVEGRISYREPVLSLLREKEDDYEIIGMEAVGDGGVFKGLWQLGESCNVGFSADLKSIPIRQETVEICNFYDINPYELYSDGVFLFLAKDGSGLTRELCANGIPAAVIGRTHSEKKRVIVNEDEERFIEPRHTDSLISLNEEEKPG